MKMTKQEYEELIAEFRFLVDKSDPGFRKETEKVLERLEKEYKKYIIN